MDAGPALWRARAAAASRPSRERRRNRSSRPAAGKRARSCASSTTLLSQQQAAHWDAVEGAGLGGPSKAASAGDPLVHALDPVARDRRLDEPALVALVHWAPRARAAPSRRRAGRDRRPGRRASTPPPHAPRGRPRARASRRRSRLEVAPERPVDGLHGLTPSRRGSGRRRSRGPARCATAPVDQHLGGPRPRVVLRGHGHAVGAGGASARWIALASVRQPCGAAPARRRSRRPGPPRRRPRRPRRGLPPARCVVRVVERGPHQVVHAGVDDDELRAPAPVLRRARA